MFQLKEMDEITSSERDEGGECFQEENVFRQRRACFTQPVKKRASRGQSGLQHGNKLNRTKPVMRQGEKQPSQQMQRGLGSVQAVELRAHREQSEES